MNRLIGIVPLFAMDCQWSGQAALEVRKIGFVLFDPPIHIDGFHVAPFVYKQANINVTVRSVIASNAAAEQVDCWNVRRRLKPIGEDVSKRCEVWVHGVLGCASHQRLMASNSNRSPFGFSM